MRNGLQQLLVILALGLCGLCAWQWHTQVQQHKMSAKLSQTIADQTGEILQATNSIMLLDQQLAQMDARLTELRSGAQSNRTEIATTRADNQRLTDTLAQANANIHQQNEMLKNVAAQRDALLQRLNEAIQDRNAVVAKYNALVKQVEESRSSQSQPEPVDKK